MRDQRRFGGRSAAILAAWAWGSLLAGCGGGGGSSPSGPPAPVIRPASLTLVSVMPADGTSVRRGEPQRFVARFRWESASDSTTPPLFLVGHLQQLSNGTVIDNPDDFHFTTPTLAGEIEVTVERVLLPNADRVTLGWVLASVTATGGTLAVPGPVLSFPAVP